LREWVLGQFRVEVVRGEGWTSRWRRNPREKLTVEGAEKRNPGAQRGIAVPRIGNPVLTVLAYYDLARESGTEVL
jgi:hypothetical protein